MHHYLNDPERTAKQISVDSDGRRWLHTGDLGFRSPDGIVIMGRIDSMVKVNGQRVEPAEVEYHAQRVPGVAECAVIPYGGDPPDRLCLFFSGSATADGIREALLERLPEYMVPLTMVRMDRLPRNRNGKIDRPSLPLPQAEESDGYVEPSDERTRIICEAFAEVLGVGRVGGRSDFVRMGGDSIKAMKAVSVCRKNGLILSVPDILTLRTPEKLSLCDNTQAETVYTTETGCPVAGG